MTFFRRYCQECAREDRHKTLSVFWQDGDLEPRCIHHGKVDMVELVIIADEVKKKLDMEARKMELEQHERRAS